MGRVVGELTEADKNAFFSGSATPEELQQRVDTRNALTPYDGTSEDSATTRVRPESKATKKDVVNKDPQDLTVFQRIVDTGKINERLTIPNAENYVPADFYRRGGPIIERDIDGVTQRFQEILPRTLQDQETETPASIRLIGKPGQNPKAKDVDLIPKFTKFFLESVQEGHAERHQIIETFGDFYVFFFGERPPIYTYTGTMLNTDNINWVEDFLFYYDNFLRGTKCVEAKAKMVLTYGFRQVEGFLLGMNLNTNAINDKGVAVSFQVLIVDRKIMKLSVDFGLIESNGKFAQDASIIQMISQGYSDKGVSGAVNDAKEVSNGKKGASNTKIAKWNDKDDLISKYKIKNFNPGVGGGIRQSLPATNSLPKGFGLA